MAQDSPQVDDNVRINIHAEFLKLTPKFRLELSAKYKWFIHVTPFSNLSGIRANGLLPMQDAHPPVEVESYLGSADVPILCLHPLGSQISPRGAEKSLILPLGAPEPKRIKLAVASRDLPEKVGLDWSYAWEFQKDRLQSADRERLHVIGCAVAHEFGSIVSYDSISSTLLRICTKPDVSIDPACWHPLNEVDENEIAFFS